MCTLPFRREVWILSWGGGLLGLVRGQNVAKVPQLWMAFAVSDVRCREQSASKIHPYSHLYPEQICWKSSGSGNKCDLLYRCRFFLGCLISNPEEDKHGARTSSFPRSWLVEVLTVPGAGRWAGSTLAHIPPLKDWDHPNSLPLPHHHILSHGSGCFCLSFPPFGWKIIFFYRFLFWSPQIISFRQR